MKKEKSNLYLGILFVVLGVLLLLDNLNILDVHFGRIWDLWPFILIIWGLKYLPMKSTVRTGVNVALIILFFFLLLVPESTRMGRYFDRERGWASMNFIKEETDSSGEEVSDADEDYYFVADMPDGVKKARMKLVLGAAHLETGDPTDKLFEFTAEDYPYPLSHKVDINGDRAEIVVQNKNSSVNIHGKYHPEITLRLNDRIPWDMELTTGATEMDLDLVPYAVEKLKIATGASECHITMGDKARVAIVEITGGAADISLSFPKNAGVEIKMTPFLTSRNIEGMKKISTGLYRTENFDKAETKIYVKMATAVSNLEVDFY